VKAPEHRVHPGDTAKLHRRAHGIDHPAVTARGEHDQSFAAHEVAGGLLVLEIVRDRGQPRFSGASPCGSQSTPSSIRRPGAQEDAPAARRYNSNFKPLTWVH